MNQTTISSFPEQGQFRDATKKVYNFMNCNLFRGFVTGPYVSCISRLKEIPANGCSSWTDGNELETMKQFAPSAGFVPTKKWRGQA